MEDNRKVYSVDEIKKIAPGYRGRPENFDPTKVGKKRDRSAKPKKQSNQSPKPGPSGELPATTRPHKGPTPRQNDIITEEIFGFDVSVMEIAPRQEFKASYNKIIDVSLETYKHLLANEKQLDRILAKEELAYYATSLLWFRLLDVKAKDGSVALSSKEKDIRGAVMDEQLNVPQPIYFMLREIGNYTDKMGYEFRHQVPDLPTTVIQGYGGYHAKEIDVHSHNLFEEVPSLGIAGDMVMALASEDKEPIPNFRVGIPAGSVITKNLAGHTTRIGPRRPEILQRLAGYGITADQFHESVSGTRFNLRYVRSISDIIGKFETFEIEKLCFKNLPLSGGETQIVLLRPTET